MALKTHGASPRANVSGSKESGAEKQTTDRPHPRVAIIGVPNSGKSLLFRRLSGAYADSANYLYTTSRLAEAPARLGSASVVLVDTPGITGLELCSEDEALTRELLYNDPPDAIVQCMDAGNLVRSLALTAQLADLEIPLVICLNMMDEALHRGIVVDPDALSRELGVPVVGACALDGRGMRKVAASLDQARPPRQPAYPAWLQAKLDRLTPVASRAHRVGRILATTHPDLMKGQSIWHMVLEAHGHWAQDVAGRSTRRTGLEPGRSYWDLLVSVALHPVGGWLFLAATLVAVFLLVSRVGVQLLAGGMETLLVQPATRVISTLTGPGLLQEILVGPFGLLSLGLFNAICTVLPILAVFYLVFGLLEDIGYFPLLSVQFDRLMRLMGLTGKAVLPITLGFGCNSVATLSTRSLETPRQRFIACTLISLGIPCAVQLGVMVAILSTVPLLVILALLGIVGILQILVGSALARLLPWRERGEFLVELPPLRPPRWGNILGKTTHRMVEFFTEACPMFVASAGLLLVLSYTGLLDQIRDAMAPVVVRGFGLPREVADMLLMTLARREVGAVMMKDLVDQGALSVKQVFVGLLVMTLFVPCLSNTLIMGKVLGWTKTIIIFVLVTAIAVGMGICANVIWA